MTDLDYENRRIMDVINENDDIVDSKSREDIHRLGLLHREIHVWFFDEDHNIFFQKAGLHRSSAGLLDATVGGHVNQDESYLEAAVRETKEETSITISPDDLVILRKYKETSIPAQYNFLSTVNNFVRTVYIHKHPIEEKQIKREVGILGGGFQKLSSNFLLDPPKDYAKMFDQFILSDELSYVLDYLK